MTKTTLTIRRPNGTIETVDVSDRFRHGITPQMFEQIKAANAAAGRGECLSYTVDHEVDAESDARIARLNAEDELRAAVAAHDPRRAAAARKALDDLEG